MRYYCPFNNRETISHHVSIHQKDSKLLYWDFDGTLCISIATDIQLTTILIYLLILRICAQYLDAAIFVATCTLPLFVIDLLFIFKCLQRIYSSGVLAVCKQDPLKNHLLTGYY